MNRSGLPLRFRLFILAMGAVSVLFWALLVWALIYVATATGPNCPGKDPDWQGWCYKAPDLQ